MIERTLIYANLYLSTCVEYEHINVSDIFRLFLKMSKRKAIDVREIFENNLRKNTNSTSTLEKEEISTARRDATDDGVSDFNAESVDESTTDSTSSYCSSSSSVKSDDKKKRIYTKLQDNWKFFEILNIKVAKCTICNQTIITNFNTTNINNHMRR
jgi:hypothetical protein